ncbi:MAG: phosphoribosylglycinamide formyltransferase [Gemmatimonadetes bacterium]|nr:phosphoribosylglycinamide formyltransferase [Gemmatimonadota bacterium]
MSGSLGISVLASGSGTNLQAMIDQLHLPSEVGVRVATVIGSRPGIGALERASRYSIPAHVHPADDDGGQWLRQTLEASGAGLVVLAGWLKLISADVVRAFRGRMINIHPALLPSFGGPGMYGQRVHQAVIESGARVSGPTVHFVDEIYDHGSIIAQWPVPVRIGDDARTLAARVLTVEHRLLPAMVRAFAEGKFKLGPTGQVVWIEPWYSAAEFSMRPQLSTD